MSDITCPSRGCYAFVREVRSEEGVDTTYCDAGHVVEVEVVDRREEVNRMREKLGLVHEAAFMAGWSVERRLVEIQTIVAGWGE